MSDSVRPHESQHARPPCPSPAPGVHSDSRPSSRWCHPAISSSVVPFSSCPQSLPASESFPMSQSFTWGGQSTGVSALASFLPKNTQGWSLEWAGWISLQSEITEKAREFQKNIYFCFIDYAKTFHSVVHSKLWKIFQEMWIPDHLTCLLRNMYACQEAIVRTEHGTTDWFQIGKEGMSSLYIVTLLI